MRTLQALGFDAYFASQLKDLVAVGWVPARIASEGQSSFHLLGCRAALGDLSGKLLSNRTRIERPVVGDWVAVADGERAVIHKVLERRTALVRRAAGTTAEAQILAANVDTFFVVTSANREFNERRLERYVAAVWNSGAEPAIVLNKIDLQEDLSDLLEAIERVALGVPVLRVSAVSGYGVDELAATSARDARSASSVLRRRQVVADESAPRPRSSSGQRTAQRRARPSYNNGAALIELPGGGLMIDTPGMRELGLLDDAGGVDVSFADVTALAEGCKFRDCAHAGEPGCAVEAAVDAGTLPAERLASYRKLLREIAAAERSRDPILAGRTKQRWKSIQRGLRARRDRPEAQALILKMRSALRWHSFARSSSVNGAESIHVTAGVVG